MVGDHLPPGFRFHPTDEELIMHYLRNQAASTPCPVSNIIPELNIYSFDPWHLPDKAGVGENEWYFFSPRDRKYPNGLRPNRAAVSGYWKATGTDKAIYSGSKYVGVKKALVFYKGKPPKGVKTDWIMHEYRLSDSRAQPYKHNGSMKLDDWVLCRIYKKKNAGRSTPSWEEHQQGLTSSFPQSEVAEAGYQYSFTHPWDSFASFSHLLHATTNPQPYSPNTNEGFPQPLINEDQKYRQYVQLGQNMQKQQHFHDSDEHQTMSFLNIPVYQNQI